MNLQKKLEKLVSFKNETRNTAASRDLLRWVERELKGLPLIINRLEQSGYPALFVTSQKTKKPKLLLAAHIDVVPGEEKQFRVQKKGERLYGRGVYDMKFAVAAYLALLQEFGPRIRELDIGVLLTSDEEVGGQNGVGAFVKKGYGARFVFLPDDGPNWSPEKDVKSLWHLVLEARGQSSHGARPWLGKNALTILMDFIQEVRGLFPPEDCQDTRHEHSTLTVSKLNGGRATNQVPDSAYAVLDMRFYPETEVGRIKKEIGRLLKKYPSVKARTEAFALGQAFNFSDPLYREFARCARAVKKKMQPKVSHGSSDAHYFRERGIPVLVIRPEGGGQHGSKEWIDVKDLARFYDVLREWVGIVGKKV